MRIENKGHSFTPWCICYLKQTEKKNQQFRNRNSAFSDIINRNGRKKKILIYQILEFKLHIPQKTRQTAPHSTKRNPRNKIKLLKCSYLMLKKEEREKKPTKGKKV